MTDSQIIALFWERNADAIQETDAVYGRKLYAISDKILHSNQDAEESVSDTYTKPGGSVQKDIVINLQYQIVLQERVARFAPVIELYWESMI